MVAGGSVAHQWYTQGWGQGSENSVGAELRHDYIPEVALYNTRDRERLSTVRSDRVNETSLGLYYENVTQWTDKFRTIAGLRGDVFHFDVDADIDRNSGTETDAIASPKLGMVLGPWNRTEVYFNASTSFHSSAVEGLNWTLALWYLELDSELLFAGATEASRPSERFGVEWANFYQVTDWLILDLDVAFTEAEFSDSDPAGDEIPGALDRAISAGATVDPPGAGGFGSLRLRHFGPRPLIEDGSVESDSTTLVNLKLGYEWRDFRLELDVLNLLDSDDHDIDYFYASRLPGEPAAGVEDIHFHPVEPRTVRLYATWFF